ncbi:MAG: hypothetical protein H7X91_06255 [Burkholderiales bacterium]|nr:hypothetical protein [Burkholderiales bacterium]
MGWLHLAGNDGINCPRVPGLRRLAHAYCASSPDGLRGFSCRPFIGCRLWYPGDRCLLHARKICEVLVKMISKKKQVPSDIDRQISIDRRSPLKWSRGHAAAEMRSLAFA